MTGLETIVGCLAIIVVIQGVVLWWLFDKQCDMELQNIRLVGELNTLSDNLRWHKEDHAPKW